MRESVQRAMFDYFGFEGQTAIVTGSGNGIGRATAIMLADLGANVMVCDIEGDSAKKVAEEITERGGAAVYHVKIHAVAVQRFQFVMQPLCLAEMRLRSRKKRFRRFPLEGERMLFFAQDRVICKACVSDCAVGHAVFP